MRIPISMKLVFMTILLLVAATLPIAFETSKYFEKTSRQREENINLDLAASRAIEVEAILNSVLQKSQGHAAALLKMANDPNFISEDINLGFMRDKIFLSLEIFKVDSQKVESLKKFAKTDFIKETYNVEPSTIERSIESAHFPLDSVAKGVVEVENATFKGSPAIFALGFPFVKDTEGRITHIAVAVLDLGVLQKPFSDVRERSFYLLDRDGIVLAHSDEKFALNRDDFSALASVKLAHDSKTPRGQKLIEAADAQDNDYVAFAKTNFGGATVFATISEAVVLEPAREVKRKTLFIAALVLSIAVFLVFVFSLTLTAPLENLAELIELVAKGNFDVHARKKVQNWFRDEVSELAAAFDHMTEGLKERDKVKRLFSKFHGSSVTDDLLQGEAKLGGQRKEVVVFFSDIRGFTSFSESRSPEEVVEMLNEYFGVMVSIINRHGGIVDKFIGDAIMAIWGTPVSTQKDLQSAVNACLEMRKGLHELNTKRISKNQPPILIGMGLHIGPAISGTIGSEERMEYTVIGNTVNTASRIEAATKAFGTDLLLSEDVCSRAAEFFATEYAGEAEVKGRSSGLKLYKVRGTRSANGDVELVQTPYSDYESTDAEKVEIKEA